jgi:hypothetical protein
MSLAAAAREELLDRVTPERDAGFRWGYVLGTERRSLAGLEAVSEVEQAVRRELIRAIEAETGRSYEFSFLKTTTGEPPEVGKGALYRGYHLDTHPDLDRDRNVELARVLVNLAPTVRTIRFAHVDRLGLAHGARPQDPDDYRVELPAGVDEEVIEIPPLEDGAAYGVRFWASVVPHVGVEGPNGHFLASYEAVADYPGVP